MRFQTRRAKYIYGESSRRRISPADVMHFAKLDLIPSQQFRGVSLPATFHITLFIAETGVSPRTVGTRETTLLPVSKEASRVTVIFSLFLAGCSVRRRDQADDKGEETSDRMNDKFWIESEATS